MMRGGLRSRRGDSHGGSTTSSPQMTLKSTLKSLKVSRSLLCSVRFQGIKSINNHALWVASRSFVDSLLTVGTLYAVIAEVESLFE